MRAKETPGDPWCASQRGDITSRELLAGGEVALCQNISVYTPRSKMCWAG